ncbi:hypothetical protein T484DRAFT_1909792 [Baffinella frigidus]|nr:hypothetical protein T484DRAFT_1909792 [Cryptophyta sp. CCMP2293]
MSVLHLVILGLCAVGSAATDAAGIAHLEQNANAPGVTVLPSGLQYRVIRASPTPDAPMPAVDSPCVCHYQGSLIDGTVFDSSVRRGAPSTFAPNKVVKGWAEALQLMREGDKWELTIPSNLAYGDRGSPPRIPGGAVLVYELEFIKVGEASAFSFGWIDFANPQLLFSAVMTALFLYKIFPLTGGGKTGATGATVSLEEAVKSPENPTVFFDITIGDEGKERQEAALRRVVLPSRVPEHHVPGRRHHRRKWHGRRVDLRRNVRRRVRQGVFGKVVTGWDTMKKIEGVGSGTGLTAKPVTIAACGEVTKKSD